MLLYAELIEEKEVRLSFSSLAPEYKIWQWYNCTNIQIIRGKQTNIEDTVPNFYTICYKSCGQICSPLSGWLTLFYTFITSFLGPFMSSLILLYFLINFDLFVLFYIYVINSQLLFKYSSCTSNMQYWHYLTACQKCNISGPNPNHNLYFHKVPK